NAIGTIAKHSRLSERELAAAAVALARESAPPPESAASREDALYCNGARAALRRRHVGYYLIDRGLRQLEHRAGYRAPLRGRAVELVRTYPTAFYLVGIELMTFLTVLVMLSGVHSAEPSVLAILLFLLPASQPAVDFMNHL